MEQKRKRRWRGGRSALLFALALCCFGAMPAAGTLTEPTVVRVGFPINEGMTEIDENGKYSGYTYEYLQEIAQYTGWEYEFVQLQGSQNEVLGKMYEMLEAGELDLMGSTNFSPELDELYDYPENSYGSVYSTLEVLDENTAINEANYGTLGGIRIAVLGHAKKGIAALNDFCRNNRIEAQLIACASGEEQLAALREKRADALLSNDLSKEEGTRIVARFNPKPYYFATTSGNYEMITKLNSAMLLLGDADPYFAATLYQKYFGVRESRLRFTDEEQRYLQTAPAFRVGMVDNRLPLGDVDSGGEVNGISMDLLRIISKKTGLRFEITPMASVEALQQALLSGEIDLGPGVTYDYNSARQYHYSMSKPYLSAQYIMAAKKGMGVDQLAGKRLALPRGIVDSGSYQGDILWYNSIPECLQAVDTGVADYCYGNGYSVEYYCSLYRYRHLTLVPQSSQINQYCIGVARPANPLLLNILNKTIRNLPQGDLQTLIYQNSVPSGEGLTLGDVIESNPWESLLIFAVLALALLALLFAFFWFQRRERQKAQLENERYQLLFDLSGEYLFEYDVAADRLTLAEKTAEAFGGKAVTEHYLSGIRTALDADSAWKRAIFARVEAEKSLIEERLVDLGNGRNIWLRLTVIAISEQSGRVNFLIGKIADIQTQREEHDRLAHRAQTDGLTGLYNVPETRLLVEQALAEAPAGTLLMMDVDRFKSINDFHGHYSGDRVLQDVAGILRRVFREQDVIGRLGGDEFVIFMQGMVEEGVIAEKCRRLAGEMARAGGAWPQPVTLSIGAIVARGQTDYDTLYHCADDLLYEAKAKGGNAFRIATLPSPDGER